MELINTISNNRFFSKHGLKAAWAFTALCLLLVLLSIAWNERTQSKVKAANYAPQKIAPTQTSRRASYRASDITGANLFGDSTPKPVVQKVAPKTTLDLTLQGVLWDSSNTIGRAIIMSGKRKSKLYEVGEQIDGAGASVKEIRSNEVILNRNGAAESLPLVKSKSSGNQSIITFSEDPLDNYESAVSQVPAPPAANIRRSSKPRSQNGEPRKIRKPNFSGLDRALKKMGEI